MSEIDAFDLKILQLLREDARRSNVDLAKILPLSHSTISRRVKKMEENGVITGYHAQIDSASIGNLVHAFVNVARSPMVEALEVAKSLQKVEAVKACWIVSGDFDILIEIVARDMPHFSHIILNKIQTLSGVSATKSTMVFSRLAPSSISL